MKNALIVDDSRLACKVMANMLASMDIKSSAVYCAEDALEYLQSQKPDVIFLDHTMPGISGLELIKLIKHEPSLSQIPVLMYTAKEGKIYAERAKELGAIEVLPKGLEKKSLSRVLSKIGLISHNTETTQQAKPIDKQNSKSTPPIDSETNRERPIWQSFWL
jgi:CheY-like chemotaxis protein